MALHKPLLIAHLVEHRREQEALDRCKDGVEGNDQQQLEAHEKVSGASDVGGFGASTRSHSSVSWMETNCKRPATRVDLRSTSQQLGRIRVCEACKAKHV